MEEYVGMIHVWVTFAIILAAIVSYAMERVSLELTSVAVVGALLLYFFLFPVAGPDGDNRLDAARLLSGFSNPALISVLALLVVGQAMFQTGALDTPARLMMVLGRRHPQLVSLMILATAFIVSAFMNNTPVVVIFIPIMTALAERLRTSPSHVMIPLSFIAVLGGMTTLIGSSTNLLVAGTAKGLGLGQIGFFDFTVPGLVLAGVGAIYVIGIVPRILPDRASMAGAFVGPEGRQFIVQFEVTDDNPLLGEAPVAGFFRSLPDMTVRMIQRGEQSVLPPFDDMSLREGDIVIVATTRKTLTDAIAARPQLMAGMLGTGEVRGIRSPEEAGLPPTDRTIAEIMVAPGSRMIGRNLLQIGFRYQTNCIVLGIQRRSRMIRTHMNDIRLEAGDVLLILGRRSDVRALRDSRDVVLLEWSTSSLPHLAKARIAQAIFAGVIALAATGILPIVVASMIGAVLMVATGCLNIRQATRAIDQRIFLIIAAALAMGTALQETGGAAIVAHSLVALLAGASPAVILSALFLLIAIMTNLLTNNATAVLFTPIAVSTAGELGVDLAVFLHAVIFAANCSFATPMAYQTNLLVMGPGHYKFSDFIRTGIPLLILVWFTFSLFAPWYYDLPW